MKKSKLAARAAAAAAALVLCISPQYAAFGETTADSSLAEDYQTFSQQSDEEYSAESYSSYYDTYSGENRPEREIICSGKDFTASEGGEISVSDCGEGEDKKEQVLVWNSDEGEASFSVEIPETGIYCMRISYYAMESSSVSMEFGVMIDGSYPYETASRLTLNKVWVNEGEITADSRGDQIRPSQVQESCWLLDWVKDPDGLFNDPLIFYMEKGTHTVTFSGVRMNGAIEYFSLCSPEAVPTYSQYKESVDKAEDNAGGLIRIEGENAAAKSDPSLYPTCESGDYTISPSSSENLLYNTIGSGTWNKALQTITFEVKAEDIPKGGWYRMGIKARQNEMRGMYSTRRIYVDGEVLCQELSSVKFYYNSDWTLTCPETDDGEDIYIYLSPGESHQITMEVIPGEIGDFIRKLDDEVYRLSSCYRQILMITGPDPDKYTDYYVHEKIPGLTDELKDISDNLKEIQSGIETLSGFSGSEAAAIERMTVILDKCVSRPLKIPDYLSQIKDNLTAVSAWTRDYRSQPLEIDYIELASFGTEFSSIKSQFLKSAEFSFKCFINSFFEDYTVLSEESSEETMTVWVNTGREQAQTVKQLTESEFIPEYGIPIAVNLVSGGIAEAALADKGPDIALFIGGEQPVNLASRGLLYDLSGFEDFSEVMERFQQNAAVNYEYGGGCYGLPVSQVWPMMFYRKDILSELGYDSPPETWDQLIEMLPALQRNYMSVGLILPSSDISAATEAGHTFATLLMQNNITYYNDEQTQTNFDSSEAVSIFEQWTDFYTKYSFDQTYDAFSRFRTGEYPIVIQSYSFYNQLSTASPEIKGLWGFTLVPGTVQEDGTIDHSTNSTGTAGIIFNKAKNKEGAWEYLKWFTSTQVQTEYGVQTEGLLGAMGRFEAANTQALCQLSWSKSDLEALLEQREQLEEIPVIPASYAVTRNIMNAFRETVNSHENPRDTLLWYNRDINEEITRKRKNMGI